MFLNVILLIIGFILLVKGADMFVDGASKLARSIGIPTLIIGLTIVAFGTSAPELAVSCIASIKGNSDISIGNVVGSNICNLLLVLGASALFGCLTCEKKVISRDYMYTLFSFIVLGILMGGFFINGENSGFLSRTNGLILVCFLIIYVYALLQDAKMSIRQKEEKEKFEIKSIIFILIGLVGVIGGGELVVNMATKIARGFGISDSVIALTVVAIGTSLPELVTSVVAVKKGETDLAIGNVLGSCIFNIFLILGVSSFINPLSFDIMTFVDVIIMFISGLVVYFFTRKNNRLGHVKGFIMLAMYVCYIVSLFFR